MRALGQRLGFSILIALLMVVQDVAGDWADRLEEKLIPAVDRERIEETRELVENGTNVNAVDRLGRTVLIHASRQDNLEAVKLPIDKGAATDIKNRKGLTAFQAAVQVANVRVIVILGL
jgi:ankyrin repeat protein